MHTFIIGVLLVVIPAALLALVTVGVVRFTEWAIDRLIKARERKR